MKRLQEQSRRCATNHVSTQIHFYETDFFALSNFSTFPLLWKGTLFGTSEAAYQWEKFPNHPHVRNAIVSAGSALEAFRLAEQNACLCRCDWDAVKVGIMRDILLAKFEQHESVRLKLLATGDRVLVEDSWRDPFWGSGWDGNGMNILGKLWMEIRAQVSV